MRLLKELPERKYGCVVALYECVCGNKSKHVRYRVRNGTIRSCGCLRKGTMPFEKFVLWLEKIRSSK